MRLSGIVLLMLCFCVAGFADFDLTAYEVAEVPVASMPSDFFYPPYFRDTDQLTFRNVSREIIFRLEFISGVRPEMPYMHCYKMQKRIERALKRYQKASNTAVLRRLDDNLLFNSESPLDAYLKPMPVPPTTNCSYRSVGDLSEDGLLYCVHHGPVRDSTAYRKYGKYFTREKPFFTAFDLVELLIFSPVLFILPVTWYIMRKVLEKGR